MLVISIFENSPLNLRKKAHKMNSSIFLPLDFPLTYNMHNKLTETFFFSRPENGIKERRDKKKNKKKKYGTLLNRTINFHSELVKDLYGLLLNIHSDGVLLLK